MKTIYKYPLKITPVQDIEIPSGSTLLSVQVQNELPCLWVLILDTTARKTVIRLRTVLTGEQINDGFIGISKFLGTYQIRGFVGHVFQTF